ncbi:hypothetical protein [Sulfuriroseicoccus oceanibius]|uniref:Uncharacterized protein n=1 Tax=Sulfuriroseicoccus oceanibius TaxID=2707525 RepID=A0A6B3L9M6_9BACT|nr:hypothetical protein [Sulfuriroseicoccus oceanibius]QQL44150.1 hypothetical protein G3M56_009605 [Sulfuriroseicoccus oceanibius]
MSFSKSLTTEQKQTLADWASEGIGLSGMQKRIEAEFGVRMTYMDTRFLALDLGLKVLEPADIEAAKKAAEPQPEVVEEELEPEVIAPQGVQVSLDELVIPGAVVSGKVSFSDGEQASWMIDQMGRFSLVPKTEGYQPSQDDLRMFQAELSDLLKRKGM